MRTHMINVQCFECNVRRAVVISLQTLRGRAEEGAGDAHVVVVGRAHHQVGGCAQPVPAAKEASPRRQRVIPGEVVLQQQCQSRRVVHRSCRLGAGPAPGSAASEALKYILAAAPRRAALGPL